MPASKSKGGRPDLISVAGLVIGLGALVGGLILEGGSIKDVSQVTAAIIVLGGTLGAVMLSTPMRVLGDSVKRLGSVFFERSLGLQDSLEEIITFAGKARKNGVVSLEQEVEQIGDPFLRKSLTLAVDGTDIQEIRNMMELEIEVGEQHAESSAKVFEAAGGYSPTIGIIGAVMGLIQVMKHLDDIKEVGHGIAVAFVATVYGVGFANLFCLPAASKIKARAHEETRMREMVLEGVVGIVEGLNPKLIRSKLEAYLPAGERDGRARKSPAADPAV